MEMVLANPGMNPTDWCHGIKFNEFIVWENVRDSSRDFEYLPVSVQPPAEIPVSVQEQNN